MIDAPPRRVRGQLVGLLNHLTRTPEPVKRQLRVAFVVVVSGSRSLPGVRRVALRLRRWLPGPYQWFAEHYEAYRRLHPERSGRRARRALRAAALYDPHRIPMTPPEGLSAEEGGCFTRLAFTANTQRKRALW